MLNKKERIILKVLNENCNQKFSCLISKKRLVELCNNSKLITEKNIEDLLYSLIIDGYLDVININKANELIYCITLHYKGKNYKEEYKKDINGLKTKIILAMLCACVSYFVGKILVFIFK